MALFGNKTEGGLMDVIRCDEQEYLVHKWTPSGGANSTKKENAIRYGSSLRVKDGELAVFVYQQKDGSMQDFIVGPHDQTIKTANFPVLTNIVGAAFGGSSPFQAEIYFINLAGNVQVKFGIPYFDIYDPRFIDLGVPCAVRGTLTFNITDYKNFIKLNRLINFELDDFKNQIKDFFIRKTKSVVLNVPQEANIPVMQIERKIDEISEIVHSKLKAAMQDDFGVNLKRLDIATIELDKEHSHYQQLKKATADQQTKISERKTDIELDNLEDTMRIQRKDMELGVEGKNFAVHQLNQQSDVLKTAAENLGEMGNINLGGGDSGGGLNPIGLMTGMAIGNAMGNQMGGMMNNINKTAPPPPPVSTYHVALNGQQLGQFSLEQLKQSAQSGQFTKQHHVWKEGMSAWELASNVAELTSLFSSVPPPPPAPPTL
jgi:membrane protease subunit (stomatin/prohibitin family)